MLIVVMSVLVKLTYPRRLVEAGAPTRRAAAVTSI